MPQLLLNAKNVNPLSLESAGQVLYRDTKLVGFGVRVGTKSVAYFVEKRVQGRTVRHTIGLRGQITADQARKLASIKLGEMTGGVDPNAIKREVVATRLTEAAQKAQAAQYTVMALCQWYIKHQMALGKQSASDAASIFAKHVGSTKFAGVPARKFTAIHSTSLIRTVVEQGHPRTAAKLRAYLRAAYALAQGAATNPQAPASLVLFGIETNPVASTSAIKNSMTERKTTLNEEEIGEVMRLLVARRKAAYDDALAAFELSIHLGGQRLAQVLRLAFEDVDITTRTVLLFDPKGRRATPRRHILPLTDSAFKLIQQILSHRRADWLFGDKTAKTTPDTLARKGAALLKVAQQNLLDRGIGVGLERPKIEARDLRRTAETMLASMGVSKDTRAQLLSHGLGGVQDRHYDQHDYLNEKRNALVAWERRLIELTSGKIDLGNVKQIRHA